MFVLMIGLCDAKREELEIYNYTLQCKRLGLSEAETREIIALDSEKRRYYIYKLQNKFDAEFNKQIENEKRKRARKERKELKEKLIAEKNAKEEKTRIRRENLNISKRKYKLNNCASLQVFIDKELVKEFKELVCMHQDTQADIIRKCLEDYISKHRLIKRHKGAESNA